MKLWEVWNTMINCDNVISLTDTKMVARIFSGSVEIIFLNAYISYNKIRDEPEHFWPSEIV